MSTVFADVFYFVGLINRTDQHHHKVVTAARQLRSDVLTTEWVLAEFADALAESASRRLVAPFIRELEADLFQRGLQRYEGRRDKDWSLTDCISFVVMEDNGIREALTGDQHFEQAGFVALLK